MKKNKLSYYTWFISSTIIVYLIYYNGNPFILNWDTFGYYAYLQLVFINKSVIIHDFSFFEKINSIYHSTPTFYQFVVLENGNIITKYTAGWAILMSPFYLIAEFWSFIGNYPKDGFSYPYQLLITIGSTFYTILGLYYLRKILRFFFNDKIVSIIFILTVFGTNYLSMHIGVTGSIHIIEFCLLAILIWNTIQFHESPSTKNALLLGFTIGMIGLTRPPDLLFAIIPIYWRMNQYGGIVSKVRYFVKNYLKPILIAISSCFIMISIQLIYWKITTGHFIINSYMNNPGEGFDWFSPHILNFLVSFRKGWLLYTPIMIFAIIGLFLWRKKDSYQGYSLIFTFLIFTYVLSCWTTWWYADSFSQRPIIDLYPLLAIGLGFFIIHIDNTIKKRIYYSIFIVLVILNIFQTWQVTNGILNRSLMTKAYYLSTFGQITKPTKEQTKLLLIYKDPSGINKLKDSRDYKLIDHSYFNPKKFSYLQINKDTEFIPIIEKKYEDLTNKDHLWVTIQLKSNVAKKYKKSDYPLLVITMEREEGVYGYSATEFKNDTLKNNWMLFSSQYLTPDIRNKEDILKCYIWNRAKIPFALNDVAIKILEKK